MEIIYTDLLPAGVTCETKEGKIYKGTKQDEGKKMFKYNILDPNKFETA